MATKNEIINSILDNEKNTFTKEELESKNYKVLNSVLSSLEDEEDVVSEKENTPNIEDIEKELRAKIEAEIKDKIRKELEEESKKNQKREIDRNRLVPVMNMTNGKLVYVSRKTGAKWVWESFGGIDEIEFYELQTMRTSYKGFLNDPLILVLDDEVVDYLGLTKKYEEFLKFEDLDVLFRMNNIEFGELLDKAPKSLIVAVVTKAKSMYESGTLESVWKVNYLNSKFNAEIGQRG